MRLTVSAAIPTVLASTRQAAMTEDTRFTVTYHIVGTEADARGRALEICLEQTVELPDALIPKTGHIREEIVGQLREFTRVEGVSKPEVWRALVSYSDLTHNYELTQFLNVVFGNTSLKEGIEVVDVRPSPALLAALPGPRFGVAGLRTLLGVPTGPLLMTALKPMGTPTAALAEMAYRFALGGIDIIKDDHGLANQAAAPFESRVTACCAAVARANATTGRKCVYMPCLNAPAHLVLERAMFAKRAGAGAVLALPGITGWDSLRALASDPAFGLPICAHPALLGGALSSTRVHGFSHRVLLGTLARLSGADMSVFPNCGGRFGFTPAECLSIAAGCAAPLGAYPAAVPTPGGGMTLERGAEIVAFYGQDVCLLIGGSLYARSDDLTAAAAQFLGCVGRG